MTPNHTPDSAQDSAPGPAQTAAPDPIWRRTRAAYQYLIHMLTQALPPPPDDTPQALIRRNDAAVAQVAALCPLNAAEAGLAVEVVATRMQALDCLRLARDPSVSDAYAMRCSAQANSMLRLAQGAQRQLAQMQKLRRGREADASAANEDAWTEYRVGQVMAEVLPPPDVTVPEPPPPSQPEPMAAAALNDDHPDLETYIRTHPARAVEIRRHGGMPDNADFPPPPPALLEALATGQSRLVRALDYLVAIPTP